ncbi:10481_t:CDS:10 [Gigaspora margarita]|uniref:10481_t:CDS:1 n=1 Tax=Gigaspora margarita TaxID=4874 RepID=A0ABM8VWN3_GIGMA|nr:10481_t:CDS:10 [Gigaspora margarita]
MAIKLKLGIDTGTNSAKVKVNKHGTDLTKGIVELEIDAGYLVARKSNNTTVVTGTESFNHTGTALQLNAVTKVRITCKLEEAERLARLVRLREVLKGTPQANTDKNRTVIVLGDVEIDDANLDVPVNATTNTEIELDDTKFTGGFSAEKVSINIGSDNDNTLDAKRDTLIELEKLLFRLQNDYKTDLKGTDDGNDIQADLDLIKAHATGGLTHVPTVKSDGTFEVVPVEEILRANANGFIISSRDAGTKNTGVTIAMLGTSGTQGAIINGAKGNLDETDAANNGGKANTDAIKALIKDGKYRGFPMFDGTETDLTPLSGNKYTEIGQKEYQKAATSTINYTVENVNIFRKDGTGGNKTSLQDCRGFHPHDFSAEIYNNGDGHGENMSADIGGAPNMEAATDLAFLGKPYKYMIGTKDTGGIITYDDVVDRKNLLFFNEIEAVKGDTLDNLGTYNASDGVGNANDDTGNYHNGSQKVKDAAKKKHDAAATFLGVYVTNYKNALNESDKAKKKTALEKVETDLQAYVTKDQSGGKIKKIRDAIAAIGNPPPPAKKLSPDKADELNNLITAAADGSDKKKVYQAFRDLDDTDAKKTDAVFDALKTLMGKLDGTIDKPSELEALSTGDDKKTAWDFVNENTKDSSGKAKADLTSAIAAAKNEMSGESEAVSKTGIESVESIQEAKDIGALFKLCKETHNTITQERAVALKSEIEAYSKDKVEKYQKESGKGFGTSALEKAAQRNEKGKKEAKRDDVDEEDMKRIQVVVTLRELTGADKTNETTELYNLLNKNSLDVYKDDNDADLEKIEKDITKIREYINANDTDPKGLARKKIDALDTKFGTAKVFLEN